MQGKANVLPVLRQLALSFGALVRSGSGTPIANNLTVSTVEGSNTTIDFSGGILCVPVGLKWP
jgi:hypothetical protein